MEKQKFLNLIPLLWIIWIVNLKDTELIVFREASNSDYKTKATLNKGIVTSLAFPNIKIEVEKIMACR